MWRLFLDDDRYPLTVSGVHDDWKLARNVDDAMWYIRTYGIPYHMSLDHDLGPNKLSGMDFCKLFTAHLIDNSLKLPSNFTFYIHSQNPVGRDNMLNYMLSLDRILAI